MVIFTLLIIIPQDSFALQISPPISLKSGGWASGDYLDIDESSRDDDDSMSSNLLKRNKSDVVRFNLDPVTDPLVNTGHVIQYTYKEDGFGNNSPYLVVVLQQNNKNIAEWTHTTPLPTSFALATQTLTELQASEITKYDKLVLKFTAKCDGTCTNQDTDSVSVSWAVLELPDPILPPGSPTSLLGIPANAQVSLSWNVPTEDGGSPITDYIVEYSDDGNTWNVFDDGTSTLTTAIVTGLTNGQQYYFRVYAVNIAGQGTFSDTITSIPVSIPSAPTNLMTTASNTRVSLSWDAPNDGGSPIIDYIVEYSDDGNTWNVFDDGTSTLTTAIVTGLTNGQQYYFRVYAVNNVGFGPQSNISNTIPIALQISPPISLKSGGWASGDYLDIDETTRNDSDFMTSKLLKRNASDVVRFNLLPINDPLVDTDHVIHYTYKEEGIGSNSPSLVVTLKENNKKIAEWTQSAPLPLSFTPATQTLTEVEASEITKYDKLVLQFTAKCDGTCTNQDTESVSVSWAVLELPTITTVPDKSINIQASPEDSQVSLSWDAPAEDGGSPIIDYIVEYSDDGNTWNVFDDGTSTLTTAIVTGLTNGQQYYFRVSAVNSIGQGSASDIITATPSVAPTVSNAPINIVATAGDTKIILTWNIPTNDGGSPIIDYLIEYNDGQGWIVFVDGTSVITSSTVIDLTNNQSYDFRVSAINAVGTSLPSNVVSETPNIDTDTLTGTNARRSPPQIQGIGFYKFTVYPENNEKTTEYDVPLDSVFDEYFPYSKHTDMTDFENYREMGAYKKAGIYYDLSKKNTIPQFFAELNQPIQLQIRLWDLYASTKIEHLSLYTSNIGTPITAANSNVEIIFEKGKPIEVKDPDNIFKYVKTSTSYEDEWLWVNFDIMFQKAMRTSGILLQSWHEFRDPSFVKVDNILEILELKTKQKSFDSIDLTAEVEITHDASNPICKINNSCFTLYNAKIIEGGIVTWFNTDSFTHTVTSGTPDNHDNRFGYIVFPGDTVQHQFSKKGIYDYYCALHPWAASTVTVYGSDLQKPEINFDESLLPLQVSSETAGGSIIVENKDVFISTTRNLKMNVSGHVQELSSSKNVDIIIIHPDKTSEKMKSVTNEDGFYSLPIFLNKHWLEGTYEIITEYRGEQIAKISFEVTDNIK